MNGAIAYRRVHRLWPEQDDESQADSLKFALNGGGLRLLAGTVWAVGMGNEMLLTASVAFGAYVECVSFHQQSLSILGCRVFLFDTRARMPVYRCDPPDFQGDWPGQQRNFVTPFMIS